MSERLTIYVDEAEAEKENDQLQVLSSPSEGRTKFA